MRSSRGDNNSDASVESGDEGSMDHPRVTEMLSILESVPGEDGEKARELFAEMIQDQKFKDAMSKLQLVALDKASAQIEKERKEAKQRSEQSAASYRKALSVLAGICLLGGAANVAGAAVNSKSTSVLKETLSELRVAQNQVTTLRDDLQSVQAELFSCEGSNPGREDAERRVWEEVIAFVETLTQNDTTDTVDASNKTATDGDTTAD